MKQNTTSACTKSTTRSVTYFKPDEHKVGGSYEHVTGQLKKLDSIGQRMIIVDDNGIETIIDTKWIYDIV